MRSNRKNIFKMKLILLSNLREYVVFRDSITYFQSIFDLYESEDLRKSSYIINFVV